MAKLKFEKAEMSVLRLEKEDVIVTSGAAGGSQDMTVEGYYPDEYNKDNEL